MNYDGVRSVVIIIRVERTPCGGDTHGAGTEQSLRVSLEQSRECLASSYDYRQLWSIWNASETVVLEFERYTLKFSEKWRCNIRLC